jgi:hypothetical protein
MPCHNGYQENKEICGLWHAGFRDVTALETDIVAVVKADTEVSH